MGVNLRGFLISRLLQLVVTMFIVSVVVFLILRLSGDPVLVVAPDFFSQEQIEQMRKFWGFDRPLGEQYITFITKAISGDFGKSYLKKLPAMEVVLNRLGNTWLLAAASAAIGVTVAVPLGVLSALKRNSLLDLIITSLSSLGTAMPGFWLGLMLIIVFSVHLRVLPAFGAHEPKSLIMPSVTLGVGMAARLSRMTRSAMLEVLNQDYVRTARSKGLMHKTVVMRHALRNALIPIVTVFGLQLGWLLGGSVVVESVFSWPGLGRLMIESISVRDNTVVQAGLLWIALSFILINYVIDVIYIILDPRINFQ
ncbi:MAG: ABC transporter permease [Chloroflexi bacterium]|nr:ABC transporter permease [Chloroflexota bacterium]